MSTNVETPSSGMDAVKWLVAIALLAGAVVGNYMYADQSVLLRPEPDLMPAAFLSK